MKYVTESLAVYVVPGTCGMYEEDHFKIMTCLRVFELHALHAGMYRW